MRLRGPVLCALLLAALACEGREERRASHLQRADAYLAQGKQPEALVALKNALAQAPEDPEINLKLAHVSVALRDGRRALFYFRETRRLDPGRIEAYLGESRLLRRADPDEAGKVLDAALELQPGHAGAHQLLAELALDRDDFEAALAAGRRAVELAPDDPKSHQVVGRAHLRRLARARKEKKPADAADLAGALAAFEREGEKAAEAERWRSQTYRALVLAEWPERAGEAADAFRAALAAAERSGPQAVVQSASAALSHARRASDAALRRWALERTIAADAAQLGAWSELAALEEQQAAGSGEAVYRRLIESRPDDAGARMAFAQFLLASDRVDEAVAQLEAGVARGTEPARLLATLAGVHYGARRPQAAVAAVERLEREHPGDPFTALARAERMLEESRLDEAKTTLRALVDSHESADAQRLLARASLRRGELADAATAADRAVELAPRDASLRSLRAHVKAAAEDWSAVLADLVWIRQRARRLSPPERLLLARTYYETDRLEQAREVLATLVAEPKPYLPALLELARREATHEPARSRTALLRAYELAPSHPEVLSRLAALDLAEGHRARALARLDQALEATPGNVEARLIRAQVLIAEGKLADATADARTAFEVAPQRPDVALLLIQLHGAQRQEEAARALLEEQQAAGRLSAPVQVLLARLSVQLGHHERAIELLEQAVAARADLPLAKNDLAYLLAERGRDLDRAQKLASEAMAALADDHRVQDTLGYVHLRRGQPDLALPLLEQAVAGAEKAGEPSASYHFHLGLALRGVRRNRSAVEAFERALALDPAFPDAARAKREREAALAGAPPSPDLF